MIDQTSSEVSAQEPIEQSLPPGLDVEVITAEEAVKLDRETNKFSHTIDDDSGMKNGRPVAGALFSDEPSAEKIYKIVFNEPSDYKVQIEDKVFNLVRLTQKDSLYYLSVIAPKIKSIIQGTAPILKILAQSYSILRHLAPVPRAALLQIAKGADIQLMRETLEDIGVKNITDNDLEGLINAAVSDRRTDFLISLFLIFGQPLGIHLIDRVEDSHIDNLIMSLSEQIAELAVRSLSSSAKKTRLRDADENWIREQVELMDTLDCAAIVHMQYQLYKDNPIVRHFLAQIMAKSENISTETHTA